MESSSTDTGESSVVLRVVGSSLAGVVEFSAGSESSLLAVEESPFEEVETDGLVDAEDVVLGVTG